jgi:hypothetical protein
MITEKPRWNVSQGDLGRMSRALQPIRTTREVADLLGISVSLVCQIENSALRKIMRALKAHDDFKREPQTDTVCKPD